MNFIYNLFKYHYKHVLKEKLHSKHIVIRCPYCGDSVKNDQHAHCYVHIEQFVFYCVRCSTGGSLSRLLYKIRDRFDIDVLPVISKLQAVNNSSSKQITLNYSSNKFLYLQKEPTLIKNWLFYNNLFVNDVSIYPLNTYNAIKQYVKEQNLQNGIVYITLGNKLLYRPFIQNKKVRFRTLHLKDEYAINTDSRLSIFSTYNTIKLQKINYASNKLIAIIAESLTDLIAFHLNTGLQAIYISTNGKYTDELKPILNIFDEIYYLVDSDAIKQEILFIVKHFTNKPVYIYIPKDGEDYRSASNFDVVAISTY